MQGRSAILKTEGRWNPLDFFIVSIDYNGKGIGRTPELSGSREDVTVTAGDGIFYINQKNKRMITAYYTNGKEKWHKGYSKGYYSAEITWQNHQLYIKEKSLKSNIYYKLSLVYPSGKTKWTYTGNHITLPVADSIGNVYVGRDQTKIFKVK